MQQENMRKIDLLGIEFGVPLPADVYDSFGELLFSEGHQIGPYDFRNMRDRIAKGVYIRESSVNKFDPSLFVEAEADETPPLAGSQEVGGEEQEAENEQSVTGEAEFETGEAAENEADQEESESSEASTAESGDTEVVDASEMHVESTLRLDEQLTKEIERPIARPERPQSRRLGLSVLQAEEKAAREQFQSALDEVSNVLGEVERGKAPNLYGAQTLLRQFSSSVLRDPSLGPLAAASGCEMDDYLVEYGLTTSLYLMTVATQMGYSSDEVIDAGVGAMFQDVGMMRLPREIRHAERDLTEAERAEVECHPIYSVEYLSETGVTSVLTLTIAYQAHERCDGSGYPRKCRKEQIHPLARVLAAIDVYVGMTSDRPYRKAKTPFQGVVLLLREVEAGRLDGEAVRLFLSSVSLFPLGSYVELSNGSFGRVVRANGENFAKPVVVIMDDDGNDGDKEVDLSKMRDLRVVKTLDANGAQNLSSRRKEEKQEREEAKARVQEEADVESELAASEEEEAMEMAEAVKTHGDVAGE